MNRAFQIGDKVTYTRRFLQSTGMYTNVPRGTVTGLEPATDGTRLIEAKQRVIYVQWPGRPAPDGVLAGNLIRVADLHKEQH